MKPVDSGIAPDVAFDQFTCSRNDVYSGHTAVPAMDTDIREGIHGKDDEEI